MVLDTIREHIHDSDWQEVILSLIAQQTPEKAAIAIREILNKNSEYEQWLHRDLLFAGTCLAEYPKNLNSADETLAEEILKQLVELEIKPKDKVGKKVRQQIFKILCSLSKSPFKTQALQLLKAKSDLIDPEQLLRYRVALGEKEAVIEEYLQRLQDDDPDVCDEAICALAKLGNASQPIVDGLIKCLTNDDSFVRGDAAWALGQLGKTSQPVIDALVKCLQDDNSIVRIQAARALIELGKTFDTVVDALVSYLQDDDFDVRYFAASALGKLGKQSDTTLPYIIRWLEQHQDTEFVDSGIDVLWGLVVE